MNRTILTLPAIAVLAVSCAPSPHPAALAGRPSCCLTNLTASTAFTDKSLYQLESVWTNDFGQPVKLGTLQGHVQVVTLFFASCTYACPVIVQDMKRIEAALPEPLRRNTGFTLITIDPERDTPEALHAYRASRQLPAARWSLLRGTRDDTLELAALLGVKYKKEAGGQFAHSNLITVLNDEGEIIHQQIGLNQSIQPALESIERAAGRTWIRR